MTPRRHDDEIATLREIAELSDRPLDVVTHHRLRRPEHPGASTVGVRFGSWPAALAGAGLPSNGKRPYKRLTREEALAAITRWLQSAEDHRHTAFAAVAAAHSLFACRGLLSDVHMVGHRKGGLPHG